MARVDRVWVVYSPARGERDLRLVGLNPEPGKPFQLDAEWASQLVSEYPCTLSYAREPRREAAPEPKPRELPAFDQAEVNRWDCQQRKMRK